MDGKDPFEDLTRQEAKIAIKSLSAVLVLHQLKVLTSTIPTAWVCRESSPGVIDKEVFSAGCLLQDHAYCVLLPICFWGFLVNRHALEVRVDYPGTVDALITSQVSVLAQVLDIGAHQEIRRGFGYVQRR
jgi:hypothetical protein